MESYGIQICVLPDLAISLAQFNTDFLVSPFHPLSPRRCGDHLRPGTTLYLRETNASREFASVGG